MSNKKVNADGRNFIYPAFKFQESSHADLMWKNGNVHLSNISSFRNNHSGKIKDPREGQASIYISHDEKANHNYSYLKNDISIDAAMIYCTTNNFFSGTLKWALSEQGKDHCVLITDLEEVTNSISKELDDYNFIGSGQCVYSGRDIYIHPFMENTLGNTLLKAPINAAWIKPAEYSEQCEVRSLWLPKEGVTSSSESINKDIEIQDYLIPIKHRGLNKLFDGASRYTILTTIVTEEGMSNAWFEIDYPSEGFSPVIHEYGGEYLLGFLSPSPSVNQGRFHNGYIGVATTQIGAIGCSVHLKNIVGIEYSVQA